MSYPEPRRIVLNVADLRRLTVLEKARGAAAAGVSEREVGPLLRAMTTRDDDPAAIERGVLLFYAFAWQLERRLDPDLTWEAAQTFDLALDLEPETADPIADAEAAAAVDMAIATGLSPAAAGELTLAQVETYAKRRREAERTAQTRRRPARHR